MSRGRRGPSTYALIAGGGTAGGTLPGVAVARALVDNGHPAETIHFVGSKRGQEAGLVGEAGFAITLLPGRGIARRLTLDNVGAVVGLVSAMVRALWIVARLRPRVVVSVGQYASLPCAIAAVAFRVPLVLVAADAVPGAALRVVSRFAKASAVAFEGTPLPNAVVTGSPVRPEILAVERTEATRAEARRTFGLPLDRVVVGVFGGSLGSRTINTASGALAEKWAARPDIAIRHVVGRRDWPEVSTRLPAGAPGGLVYQAVEYEDRMPLLLAAADVMVCRAGASTVAELSAVGVPAVLVPLPGAPGDHQTANARALVGAGAAVLVPDAELDADRLGRELDAMISDPGRLERMAAAAASLGRPDAARAVAGVVEGAARA